MDIYDVLKLLFLATSQIFKSKKKQPPHEYYNHVLQDFQKFWFVPLKYLYVYFSHIFRNLY